MIYAVLGFVFGLLIPYFARRFSKFMPATPAYALLRIVLPVKQASKSKRKACPNYQKLMKKYQMRSLGWAIITAALSYCAYSCFGGINVGWYLSLIWILLLLYEIDERMLLLPDILTVPLLILGFGFSAFGVFSPEFEGISVEQLSVMGAAAGYTLPIIASLFLIKKHPDAFGGGDIKLLAAAGAWLGFGAVPYLILLSCVIFAMFSIVKRQRAGAFGPAIVIATLMLVFFSI